MDMNGWLRRSPVIAILRGVRPDEVERICAALEEAGVLIVEVPLNSPGALDSVALLARGFGDRMLVGAGTVTEPDEVGAVAAAGGRVIVSPHADTRIVLAAKAAGLFSLPGCSDPTEAFACLKAGADALKLFPSDVLGMGMMKALQAVMPKTAVLIPVGGVDEATIGPWMAAGAGGVGVGSSLYRPGDDAAMVGARAKGLIEALRAHRNAGGGV